MQSLKINGVERQFATGEIPATLAELLAELSIEANAVVAEVDGAIVRVEDFAQTQLKHGQSIELIKFMGGG